MEKPPPKNSRGNVYHMIITDKKMFDKPRINVVMVLEYLHPKALMMNQWL